MRLPTLFFACFSLLLLVAPQVSAQSEDCDCPSCVLETGQTPSAQPAPEFEAPPRSAPPLAAQPSTNLEDQIISEMNLLRRSPARYAAKLEAMASFYEGALLKIPGQVPILTQEGVAALEEAIAALKQARPAPPLSRAEGLARAAMDHVDDLGTNGHVGHFGSNGSGPAQRASAHGRWRGSVAENITFGSITAAEVVIDLLVDDGVADRGHRRVLLGKTLRRTGVSCGPHPTYRQACVITYADGYSDNARTRREAGRAQDAAVVPEIAEVQPPPQVRPPNRRPTTPERPRYEAPIARSPDDEIIEL